MLFVPLIIQQIVKYYSTRLKAPLTSLADAILHSEAPDGGLYLPQSLPKLPGAIYNNLAYMALSDISYFVANTLFSPEIPSEELKRIGEEALNFPMPMVRLSDDIYALELFHGPTGTIKDVCARYWVRLLAYFGHNHSATLHVLVATNGNSGSALAKAASELPGVKFHVIYPKDTRPELIRKIAGQNPRLHAVPVDGNIDDCRKMISQALNDRVLNEKMRLTSANAFNIGIVLPQIIYYFYAWAQLKRLHDKLPQTWIGVPCGNGGGLLAGYMAMLMGLPVQRLIASCNLNDAMHRYLSGGTLCSSITHDLSAACCGHDETTCSCPEKRPTVNTPAYAMDAACPSNIPRFHQMCKGDVTRFRGLISSASVTNEQILATISEVKERYGYDIDPHGAVAFRALADSLPAGAKGIVIASRKPGEAADALPQARYSHLHRIKPIAATYPAFKKTLIDHEF